MSGETLQLHAPSMSGPPGLSLGRLTLRQLIAGMMVGASLVSQVLPGVRLYQALSSYLC